MVWTGGAWERIDAALDLIALAGTTRVAEGPTGSAIDMAVTEELLSGLSGASIDSTITIPDRAIVLGVSTRTVTAITGAASYDCGIAGEQSKFGGSLGIAADSTNSGVIGPTAFYSPTRIRLTANGGSFAGGAVRIAIHYLLPRVSQSWSRAEEAMHATSACLNAELELLLARAAEEGARRALSDGGLGGNDAVLTIHDMRSLRQVHQLPRCRIRRGLIQ